MDKKEAEEEAMRKAKQAHNAAGKNTGMSGRDLVRHNTPHEHSILLLTFLHSSNIIQSGSRRRTMATAPKTGIWISTGNSRRTRIWPLSRSGLQILACETGSAKEKRKVVVVVESDGSYLSTCTLCWILFSIY